MREFIMMVLLLWVLHQLFKTGMLLWTTKIGDDEFDDILP